MQKNWPRCYKDTNYTADTITLRSKKRFFNNKKLPLEKNNYLWNLYNRAHTPWDWHKKLFKEAKKIKSFYFHLHLMRLQLIF